ncbi:MAG: ATP-binding protein [Xanthomonadales bacterium]|nr:ATP-binding protein [Xanthomonadales bacterium]
MAAEAAREESPDAPASARRPASLRRRLVAASIAVVAVSLGIVGAALDAAFLRSAEADLSAQMETWTYLVLGAIEVGPGGEIRLQDELGDPRLSQPGSGIYVHVHGEHDHWSSPSALGVNLPELDGAPPGESRFLAPEGTVTTYRYQYGVAWEVEDNSVQPFTVSVLADADFVLRQVRSFRRGLWRSLGGAGLLLAFAVGALFAVGLRPLRRIAGDVARIERGEADRLAGPYPRELEPLTRNLDRLLATEKKNQARYRNALDSLAHSLKTPLAVIRAGLARGERADLAAMQEAVDDMQHLITSRLERAAASTRRTLAAPVRVRPQVERVVKTMRKVHSQKLRSLDVRISDELDFYGEQRDLIEMVGNLLDNACKYGDGEVRIAAGAIDGQSTRPGMWMTVENDGRPLDPERHAGLLERGVRGDERVDGHGLGLTIVLELVSAYGGDITIEKSELGGALFRVTMPPG